MIANQSMRGMAITPNKYFFENIDLVKKAVNKLNT
jgi:hypothetical protein